MRYRVSASPMLSPPENSQAYAGNVSRTNGVSSGSSTR